ncbi:alkaline phosphatase D [Aneurinibacillus thermoaerophilus]|uniref:Alkaline phosphatase D n=1 Tax=Aneurinibacillus thermoaerophilus TaxID=143495 RepID=A0A1G7YZM9_ANETH|nr:alkaline phosphatase D [Aneurinibacillus thermoaerophilus]
MDKNKWLQELCKSNELNVQKMGRREFLRATGKIAGLTLGLTLLGSLKGIPVDASPKFKSYPFTLGVASGDPSPDGAVLWTRLAPDPLNGGGMPFHNVPVQWEVALDEGFRHVVQRGTEFARAELAHSVHVEVNGLRPDTWYYYRFKAGAEISPTGRTKTLPAVEAPLARLTFAFASCQQYEHGYFTAYRRMAEEDLDVVFHLGDYIYEYGANEYVADGGNVRTHQGSEIMTLEDYRNRYAQYKTDADLREAHAAFPWIVTWDDHEVENNYAGPIPEKGQSPEAFMKRRIAAYQAYYEHMPLRRSSLPQGVVMQLYRRFAYGNLAEFHVLDTRQYRDDQANGDGSKPPSPESLNPQRTLLGTEQEKWLLDGLTRSGARWNVLAQQVFFCQRDYTEGPGQKLSMDAWDGYPANRDRLVNFMAEHAGRNFVVLTGDVHANWAAEIKKDFNDSNSATLGVEIVGTSITSGGDGSDVRADTERILQENPHIKFFNNHRGYVRCTVTPEKWQTDYRVLPYVSRKGAPVVTRASFVTESGKPGLILVGEQPVATTHSLTLV